MDAETPLNITSLDKLKSYHGCVEKLRDTLHNLLVYAWRYKKSVSDDDLIECYASTLLSLNVSMDTIREVFKGIEIPLCVEGGDCGEPFVCFKMILVTGDGVDFLSKYVAPTFRDCFGVDPLDRMPSPHLIGIRAKPGKIDRLAHAIAQDILGRRIVKTFYHKHSQKVIDVYCYDPPAYRPCEQEILQEIRDRIPEELTEVVGRRVVNEAMFRIMFKTRTPLESEPLTIAFKNTLLDWDCVLNNDNIVDCLREPSPDVFVFHRIPHHLDVDKLRGAHEALKTGKSYEEIASQLCPSILKAFRDWVGEKWLLLFELMGYTLLPRYDLNKAIMLVGDGANGKSTYLRLIRDMVGYDNTVSVSLQELMDQRFSMSTLYHKLVNIYADLPSIALTNTGRFKILTGDDQITADRKFRDPVTFTNYAKLFFSANELPRVSDTTGAFWRRWIVIEFPNKFPQNPSFYETLRPELAKALIVALLAFREAWRRRKFSFEETEADYRHKWMYQVDTVYAFLHDAEQEGIIKRDTESKTETNKLYQVYITWSQANDRSPLDKSTFTRELERHGHHKVKIKNKHYYKGIALLKERLETEESE